MERRLASWHSKWWLHWPSNWGIGLWNHNEKSTIFYRSFLRDPCLHDGMKPGLSSVLQRAKDKQVKSNPHVWNPKYTHELGYGLCLLITFSYIYIYHIYNIYISISIRIYSGWKKSCTSWYLWTLPLFSSAFSSPRCFFGFLPVHLSAFQVAVLEEKHLRSGLRFPLQNMASLKW